MVFLNLNITNKDISLLINNTNNVINISEISICNINATDTISFSIYKKIGTTIAAYGNMSIDIVVTGTGLTTSNVGQAVWSVLAANNNVPLTMGAKLNSAASAGDPWSTILPGSYTGDEAGKIVADLETLIKQVKALTAANL